jgi:glycosyltransferase domain-containing protein
MNKMSKITVVIPSRGREKYLNRTVQYWLGVGVHVVVFEDTASPSTSLRKLSEKNSKLNYHWSEGVSVAERLMIAMKSVNTDFCIWSSDDEFVLPSALVLSVDALGKEDWIGCSGRSLWFWRQGNHVAISPIYSPTILKSNSDQKRIDELLDDYKEPLLWNFFRTEVLVRASRVMVANQVALGGATELVHATAIAIQGKVGSIDTVMRLRSGENVNQWTPGSQKFPSFASWWVGYPLQREEVLQGLTSFALERDPSSGVSQFSLARSFNLYMSKHLTLEIARTASKPVISRLRTLLIRLFAPTLIRIRSQRHEKSLSGQTIAEVQTVRSIVRDFHLR